MSNSMGPDQTKPLSSLIWVQTICKSSPQIPVSCILYVKYHDSRPDPTLIEPDLGPNVFAKVHHNFLPVKSLCQTAWVQIRPNNCQAWSGSKLFVKVHPKFLSVTSLCQIRMGPDQTKHLPSPIWVQTICKSAHFSFLSVTSPKFYLPIQIFLTSWYFLIATLFFLIKWTLLLSRCP